MAFFPSPPLHDFPDRAHRQLLEQPANLGELIDQVAPNVARGLILDQAQLLNRDLPLPAWRKRENDLFFRIPFRESLLPDVAEVLVGVLVEHQSQPDQGMALRTLVYATAFWDQQWKDWEKQAAPKGPLRLCPVLPIVFHTGAVAWSTHRTLAGLFASPEALRTWVPVWQPVFWDLAEQPLEALQQSGGAWRKAMAVVRADRLDAATFQEVTAAVAKDLEPLVERDKMRWHDLMCFVVAWGKHRRSRHEWAALDQVTRASITQVALRQEVQTMSQAVEQSWAEWAQEHYTALGEARGELRGELRARRSDLRILLEERFGPLPEAVRQRIEATDNLVYLESALRQVVHMNRLDELQLPGAQEKN